MQLPARAAILLALLAAGACAHVEPPSGGPEDRSGPQLLVTRPDSLAVFTDHSAPVVLVFDERISERGVQDAVMVSPRTSMVRVGQRGDEIRVSLREGWEPGNIYHVTVLPEIQDLFGNRRTEPVTFVFSTGPAIPETEVAGEVSDRITGETERNIRVEAIRLADSLVYAVPTDSGGSYRFRRIPEGEYQVRAYRDLNRNRELDAFEPRDSAVVQVAAGDGVTAPLAILLPDTTAAQIASVTLAPARMEIRFDDHLDPEQQISPGRVQIIDSRGSFLAVDVVEVGAAAGARAEAADTATRAPRPSQTLLVRLASDAVAEPGMEYRVRVQGIRNVHGLVGDAETTFTAPEEAPAEPPTPAEPVSPEPSP